jgi:DNA repair protein RadC
MAGANPAEIRRIIACQKLAEFSAEFRASETVQSRSQYEAAATIAQTLPGLKYLEHEEFWVLPMDTKCKLLRPYKSSQGINRSCPVHPREVFAPAIEQRANVIMTVHNHPSGDLTPSSEDFDTWYRLGQSADIIGIPVLDNFVISRRGVYSAEAREIVLFF